MSGKGPKAIRCTIYTRKSTDHGLELEFNSLDAQREACEAYIKSQASQGWQAVPKRYDDPAYSGGNLDRPAVQRLLKDIEAGLIDVVVVYKIDRLTRSLADFAKLVEVFDARAVSFVAVTQQFNTTTSMGRLTLNVLLSFAQFERELASERVRDKVAASRKKGKWTGGSLPLGYDSKDKRLVVNPAEAKIVRMIFSRYLALRSFQKLIDELNGAGIATKRREIAGRISGAIPFTYGPLAYLLKNRTYRGQTGHSGSWFNGEHEPIISSDTFEQVQELLKTNSAGRTGPRQRTGALLSGLIYDDRGNRLSPSYSVKNGIRYPFYVSSALLRGHKERVGSAPRIAATEIEAAVLLAVRSHLSEEEGSGLTPRMLIEQWITRIVVSGRRVVISLRAQEGEKPAAIEIPRSEQTKRDLAHIDEENAKATAHSPNPALLQALIRAHVWLRQLFDGTYESVEALAKAADIHPKVVRSRIKFAFLAPAVTRALLNEELAPTLGVDAFNDVPLGWDEQQRHLGVSG